MDFYEILEIQSTATKSDIKKAYRSLAIKYHPDKNKDPESLEKFRDIQTAYEVLYDDIRRKEYDNMTNTEKTELYDAIKKYFFNMAPKYEEIYDMLIQNCYGNENEFRKDFNSFNFKNIYNRIVTNVTTKIHDVMPDICDTQDNNIILNTNLKDIYLNKYQKVNVKNESGETQEIYVPLSKNEIMIHNTVIRIICDNDNPDLFDLSYKRLNDKDILLVKNISLSEYLYGSKIKIKLPDETDHEISFDSQIEKIPILKISNMGLPINDNYEISDISELSDKICDRGDLYVYLKIDGVNSLRVTDIDDEYSNTIHTYITTTFPPLT